MEVELIINKHHKQKNKPDSQTDKSADRTLTQDLRGWRKATNLALFQAMASFGIVAI